MNPIFRSWFRSRKSRIERRLDKTRDTAAFAQQLDRALKALLALEQMQPKPRAARADIGIDVWIAEALVDSPHRAVVKQRRELRQQLPISQMPDHENVPAASLR